MKPKEFGLTLLARMPGIFRQPPATAGRGTGVATLLCHRHVTRYIYAMLSLFWALGYRLPLYVMDDGTLTEPDMKQLHDYFTVTIGSAAETDISLKKILKPYKNITASLFNLRKYTVSSKLALMILAPFTRYILMDSDVLFFRNPAVITAWIGKKSGTVLYLRYPRRETHYLSHYEYEYTLRSLLGITLGAGIDPFFNAGFVCIPDTSYMDLSVLDGFCALENRIRGPRLWSFDEVATSYLVQHSGRKSPLPIGQYQALTDWTDHKAISTDCVCLHYTYDTKQLIFHDIYKLISGNRLFRTFPPGIIGEIHPYDTAGGNGWI